MATGLRAGGIRGAVSQGAGSGEAAGGSGRPAAGSSAGVEASEPGVRNAADQGRSEAVRGAADQRDGSAADAAGGEAAGGAGEDAAAGAGPKALRAGRAEPALAVGHLHFPVAPTRAGLPLRLFGRPLPLRGGLVDGPPPEGISGAGGAGQGDREVWGAEGGLDRQRPAVHGLAGGHPLRGGAEAARDPPPQVAAAASADPGKGGAILEDLVGRISLPHGVCELRGLPEPALALHRWVQFPAAAPGAGRADAGGPVFPGGGAGTSGSGSAGAGELAAPLAAAADAEAFLHRGQAGRPGDDHLGRPRRSAGAVWQGSAADHLAARGGD